MSFSEGKIRAVLIIEVLGRPPEHLKKTLEEIIEKISAEKKVKVIEKKINEAVELKEKKDIYTNFAEIEIELEGVDSLFFLTLKYMPAHVDIIFPEQNNITNSDLSAILNDLARKLHEYDDVARVMQIQNSFLQDKIKEFMQKEKKSEEKK